VGAAHNLGSLATLTSRLDTLGFALCFTGLRNLSIRIERTREKVEEQKHDAAS